MAELLLEIGTEEIPARMMAKAASDLKKALSTFLDEALLAHDEVEANCAPRQIVVICREVAVGQEDREELILGPPVRIAYDKEGGGTKALAGFLRKNPSLNENQLIRIEQPKGEVVAARVSLKGRSTLDLLAEAIPNLLATMHFAKNMRWGHQETRFVRPVRSICALLNGRVIPFSFAGMASGDHSFGHRVWGKGTFQVTGIDSFYETKRAHGIVCRHEDRRVEIDRQIAAHLQTIGGTLVPDEALLREVSDLVELPYVVLGSFDAKFLEIPREVLVTSMREHQKSFTIQNEAGELMPYFLSVASVGGDEKGLIRKGNEWVLNARLWDAKFFWESDLKKNFENLRNKLKQLVFQRALGSYEDKTERISDIANWMGRTLKWDSAERGNLKLACRYAKVDLVSELVFEFPELQGQVGGLLLREQGQPDSVWQAVYDHYLPLSMDDDIPLRMEGALVSIADKIDTLVGCFSVGLIPTGSKDPYALRRAAQGIVRVLIEKAMPIPLNELVDRVIRTYEVDREQEDSLQQKIMDFLMERVRYVLKRKGFNHDLIRAVMANDSNRVDLVVKRAEAVAAMQERVEFRGLALNLKRMNNVIADEVDKLPNFDESLLSEEVERVLWTRYSLLEPRVVEAVAAADYVAAMAAMSDLAEPVEDYFGTDGVYINVDEEPIRLNRKSMIQVIRLTLGLVADISCLAPKA